MSAIEKAIQTVLEMKGTDTIRDVIPHLASALKNNPAKTKPLIDAMIDRDHLDKTIKLQALSREEEVLTIYPEATPALIDFAIKDSQTRSSHGVLYDGNQERIIHCPIQAYADDSIISGLTKNDAAMLANP